MRVRRGCMLLLGAAMAAASPALAGTGDGERAVLEAQDRRFAATVAADLDALGRILADDVTYTHSSGVVESRAEYLEALKSGKYRYRSMAPEERRVRVFSDVAVVTGACRVLVQASGRERDIRLRFTEVYLRRDGAWRMVAWQSTLIP